MANVKCWEFKDCGKEKECPAYPKAGRRCWKIEKAVCRGKIQGTYDDKIGSCRELCNFYADILAGKI